MPLSALNESPMPADKQRQAGSDSKDQIKSSKLTHSWANILPNPKGCDREKRETTSGNSLLHRTA